MAVDVEVLRTHNPKGTSCLPQYPNRPPSARDNGLTASWPLCHTFQALVSLRLKGRKAPLTL